jgi:hypothetical protein
MYASAFAYIRSQTGMNKKEFVSILEFLIELCRIGNLATPKLLNMYFV